MRIFKEAAEIPSPKTLLHNRRDVAFLIAVAILAGLTFPLTTILAGTQNADGVITALISTQKLTWYFWGQDRFLNFIPALAMPIVDVEWNLRFQIFLRTFFAFLAPLGVLYFFSQSVRFLTFCVVLTNCLLVLTLGSSAVFNLYVVHNPFGTSLVLFVLSLVLSRSGQRQIVWQLAALAIGFLAYATNIALLVIALPLIATAFCFALLPRPQLLRFFIINLLCIALAYLHSRLYGMGATPAGSSVSWQSIHSGYAAVASNISYGGWGIVAITAISCGVYSSKRDWLVSVLIVFGCVALIGVLSCSVWVQLNGYDIRYFLIFLLVGMACFSYLLCRAASRVVLDQRFAFGSLAIVLAVTWFVGLHGLSRSYTELVSPPFRGFASDVAATAIDNRAQLLIGDYWQVWPIVFEAHIQNNNRSDQLPVYGAAWRGDVLRKRILRLSWRKRGIQALCLLDSVDACSRTGAEALHTAMSVIPGSVRAVTVASKRMLLMTVTLEPTASDR